MGCKCIGPTKDKYSIENILYDKMQEPKGISSNIQITEYVQKVFCLINKIRVNPSEFVSYIQGAEKYIKEINGRIIFDDSRIKVFLNEGIKMFKDCEDRLRDLKPMEALKFCDEIVLDCPTDESNIKDINYFKDKVLEKKEKFGIEAYFKDSIRIPEISVLLMLVDDSVKNPKRKRETILNPNYKYIGISSSDSVSNIKEEKKDEGNNNENKKEEEQKKNENNNTNKPFCAYFTFK